jgi:long-subunit acyl-CoA synthetase (AMP-forming)
VNSARIRLFGSTLLAVAGCSLIACGGKNIAPEEIEKQAFEDLRVQVRDIVDDATREAEILVLIDQLQGNFDTLRSAMVTRRADLRALNADYDATREQFAELIERHGKEVKFSHAQFMRSRQAFVSATTPDEWSAMGKSNTKSMATLARSLQSI